MERSGSQRVRFCRRTTLLGQRDWSDPRSRDLRYRQPAADRSVDHGYGTIHSYRE